jgi:hypothetical protein
MIFELYANEGDPKFTLCVKCGRYVKINRDCECDLLDSIRANDGIDITKRYTKGNGPLIC